MRNRERSDGRYLLFTDVHCCMNWQFNSHHMPHTNQDWKAITAPFKSIHVCMTPELLSEHWAAHPFQYFHGNCAEPGRVDDLFGQNGLKRSSSFSASKGAWPDSISYSSTPRAHQSTDGPYSISCRIYRTISKLHLGHPTFFLSLTHTLPYLLRTSIDYLFTKNTNRSSLLNIILH